MVFRFEWAGDPSPVGDDAVHQDIVGVPWEFQACRVEGFVKANADPGRRMIACHAGKRAVVVALTKSESAAVAGKPEAGNQEQCPGVRCQVVGLVRWGLSQTECPRDQGIERGEGKKLDDFAIVGDTRQHQLLTGSKCGDKQVVGERLATHTHERDDDGGLLPNFRLENLMLKGGGAGCSLQLVLLAAPGKKRGACVLFPGLKIGHGCKTAMASAKICSLQ